MQVQDLRTHPNAKTHPCLVFERPIKIGGMVLVRTPKFEFNHCAGTLKIMEGANSRCRYSGIWYCEYVLALVLSFPRTLLGVGVGREW